MKQTIFSRLLQTIKKPLSKEQGFLYGCAIIAAVLIGSIAVSVFSGNLSPVIGSLFIAVCCAEVAMIVIRYSFRRSELLRRDAYRLLDCIDFTQTLVVDAAGRCITSYGHIFLDRELDDEMNKTFLFHKEESIPNMAVELPLIENFYQCLQADLSLVFADILDGQTWTKEYWILGKHLIVTALAFNDCDGLYSAKIVIQNYSDMTARISKDQSHVAGHATFNEDTTATHYVPNTVCQSTLVGNSSIDLSILAPYSLKENDSVDNQEHERTALNTERLNIAIESGDFGIWEYNLITETMEWDEATFRLYSLDPMLFQPNFESWMQAICPEDRSRCRRELFYALQHSSKVLLTFHTNTLKGFSRYISCQATIIRNEHKEAIRIVGIQWDKTNIHLTEEQLRNNEDLLNDAQQISHLGSWEWNAETEMFTLSREAFHIFGLVPENSKTLSLENYISMVYPYDVDEVKQHLYSSFRANQNTEFCHRIIRADGEIRDVTILNKIVRDTLTGNPKIRGIIQDVTEQKNILRQRNNALERLNIATQASGVGVWDYTLETKNMYWDSTMYAIFERSPTANEIDYTAMLEVIHPDDRDNFEDIFKNAIENRTSFSCQHRLYTSKKNLRHVQTIGKILCSPDGVPTNIIGTCVDTTDEVHQSEEIQKIKELLNESQLLAKVGSWEYNILTGQMLLSPVMTAMILTNTDHHSIAAQHHTLLDYIDRIHYDDRALFLTLLEQAIEHQQSFEFDHRLFDRNDTMLYVTCIGEPVVNNKGRIIKLRASVQDISERRSIESQLRHAKEMAESASKAKSEFLANMSHELRTPLNAILGFTDMLSMMITDPVQKEYASIAHSSGKGLLQIINDVLDLSKVEAGKMIIHAEPTSLKQIIADVGVLFTRQIQEKNIEFITSFSKTFPSLVLLDELRIRQILFNLIGNALKFTNEGTISVALSYLPNFDNENLCTLFITISDTGIGIPKQQQNVIFEAFSQVEGQSARTYGGTGLGLSICRRLVDAMNGRIEVQSEVGIGTAFSIAFSDIPIVELSDDAESSLRLSGKDDTSVITNTDACLTNGDIPAEISDLVVSTPKQATLLYNELAAIEAHEWQKAQTTLFSDDVECFVTRVESALTDFNSPGMCRYITKVRSAISSFDVVTLQHEVGRYRTIVDSVRKHVDDSK